MTWLYLAVLYLPPLAFVYDLLKRPVPTVRLYPVAPALEVMATHITLDSDTRGLV